MRPCLDSPKPSIAAVQWLVTKWHLCCEIQAERNRTPSPEGSWWLIWHWPHFINSRRFRRTFAFNSGCRLVWTNLQYCTVYWSQSKVFLVQFQFSRISLDQNGSPSATQTLFFLFLLLLLALRRLNLQRIIVKQHTHTQQHQQSHRDRFSHSN